MTAVAIRKKLVSYLAVAEEQKVKAIYALLKDDIEQEGRIDIKKYNKELAEAEAEFAKGDYISNTAMKKKDQSMVKYSLVWTRRAQQQMLALYKYISKESPQNAKNVLNDIISAAEKAISNPERYNADKYKIDNNGSYRAFEKHHYRIVYRYQKNIIRVLRVKHTSMEPKQY